MVLKGFYFQNMAQHAHLNNGDERTVRSANSPAYPKPTGAGPPYSAITTTTGGKIFLLPTAITGTIRTGISEIQGDYYFQKGKANEPADTFIWSAPDVNSGT